MRTHTGIVNFWFIFHIACVCVRVHCFLFALLFCQVTRPCNTAVGYSFELPFNGSGLSVAYLFLRVNLFSIRSHHIKFKATYNMGWVGYNRKHFLCHGRYSWKRRGARRRLRNTLHSAIQSALRRGCHLIDVWIILRLFKFLSLFSFILFALNRYALCSALSGALLVLIMIWSMIVSHWEGRCRLTTVNVS